VACSGSSLPSRCSGRSPALDSTSLPAAQSDPSQVPAALKTVSVYFGTAALPLGSTSRATEPIAATPVEVVLLPALSVAVAVMVWLPLPTVAEFQVTLGEPGRPCHQAAFSTRLLS
jgi:hypothetical protein